MITLTKDMEIGVAKVDDQHRELIDRINTLQSMGSKTFTIEETQKTLDLLGKYVVQHFSDEEALQMKCNYPKYEQHKEMHKKFIYDFVLLKKEFEKHGASFSFTTELHHRIISWIVRHIQNADAEFGRYYVARAGGQERN